MGNAPRLLQKVKLAKNRGLACNINNEKFGYLETRRKLTEILNINFKDKDQIPYKVPFEGLEIFCSKKDINHATSWDYDLIEVFKFKKIIKESLENKDLIKLTSLLIDESDDEYYGPTKKISLAKISMIFSQKN